MQQMFKSRAGEGTSDKQPVTSTWFTNFVTNDNDTKAPASKKLLCL